jgi:hypothetical protein
MMELIFCNSDAVGTFRLFYYYECSQNWFQKKIGWGSPRSAVYRHCFGDTQLTPQRKNCELDEKVKRFSGRSQHDNGQMEEFFATLYSCFRSSDLPVSFC